MLALRGEKSALWKAWKRRDQSFYQAALECRTIGQHWINIKAMIIARRNGGEAITIQRWAEQHAPVSVRWLNEYADFASRWNEFLETWRWSKDMPYSPKGRAGLHTFLDLMLAKRRYDCVSRTRQLNFGGRGGRVECPGKNSVPMSVTETSGNVETLTPTNRLICGDVAASLQRHVGDATVDVGIADPPYWLSRYYRHSRADQNYVLAGMTPRFDEPWDRFGSVEEYEREAERWLSEVMRCLKATGSMFVFGSYHNAGLINRICQIKGYYIVGEIIWVRRNSRPNAATKQLQASHISVLWVAKQMGHYRFDYLGCKRRDYSGDYFAERGKQLRDVWDIPAAPQENKRYGHPSPKPLALYERMLDVAGVPGGLLLDLFSGSGTGTIAAMRWGMESIAIEREPAYCDMIRRRLADELLRH